MASREEPLPLDPDTRFWRWAGVTVLLLAVVLRVLALSAFEETLFAKWPQVDAYTYWDQAQQMFKGKDPFEGGYYQPPGYPWLLAVVFRAVGEPSLHAARVFNLMLGFFSTLAILWMGNHLGRPLRAPWLGTMAAALFLLYPSTLLFELDILTPAVTTALFLAALMWLWAEHGPGPHHALMAGLWLGLVAMIHPTYLLTVPAMLLALVLWRRKEADPVVEVEKPRGEKQRRARKQGAEPRRKTTPKGGVARPWLVGMALVLGTLVGVSPTALQNLLRWDQVALVSHNAGINLYLGNNPNWQETSFLRPGIPFRQLVLEADPDRRDQFERNTYWLKRTRDEIIAQPAAFVTALATKALWSFNRREIPRNEEYLCRTQDGPTQWIGWLPAHFAWLFPFAVLAAVRLWRRDSRVRLLVLCWGALHAVLVIFLVADRYRIATWPTLCLLAAGGMGEAVHLLHDTFSGGGFTWPRPRLSWAIVILAALLPWWPIHGPAAFQPAWCTHLKGNFAVSEKQYDEAERYYRETLALDPEDLSARRWLAQTLFLGKRAEEAAETLRPVVEAFPEHYPSQILMVQIYEKLQDWDAAAEHSGQAYRIPGPRTNTGIRYVRNLVRAGHVQVAREVAAADPELAHSEKVREILAGD